MRAEGIDPYKIVRRRRAEPALTRAQKQQDKVVQETLIMVPNTQQRLGAAVQELHDLVVRLAAPQAILTLRQSAATGDLQDTEEFKQAQAALESAAV